MDVQRLMCLVETILRRILLLVLCWLVWIVYWHAFRILRNIREFEITLSIAAAIPPVTLPAGRGGGEAGGVRGEGHDGVDDEVYGIHCDMLCHVHVVTNCSPASYTSASKAIVLTEWKHGH